MMTQVQMEGEIIRMQEMNKLLMQRVDGLQNLISLMGEQIKLLQVGARTASQAASFDETKLNPINHSIQALTVHAMAVSKCLHLLSPSQQMPEIPQMEVVKKV